MATITTHIRWVDGLPLIVPHRQIDIDEVSEHFRTKKPVQATVLKFTHNHLVRRWYWGIVQEAADGLGIYKDDLHAALRFKAGLIQTWILGPEGPLPILRSTKQDEIEPGPYLEYVHRAIDVLFQHYLDATERPVLFRRVEDRVGFPCPW